MLISQNAFTVLKRLQEEAQTYAVPEGSPGHEGVWTPDGQVRYWQVPPTTGELLYSLAKGKKAKSILELGCSAGYSSIWLGLAAKVNKGHVHTVEMAQAKVEMAKKNLAEAEVEDVVTIYQMTAFDFFALNDRRYDLVFLDADKLNYNRYFYYIDKILDSGGMLIADNAVDFGHLMQDFLHQLSHHTGYQGAVYNIDHGLAIYEKS